MDLAEELLQRPLNEKEKRALEQTRLARELVLAASQLGADQKHSRSLAHLLGLTFEHWRDARTHLDRMGMTKISIVTGRDDLTEKGVAHAEEVFAAEDTVAPMLFEMLSAAKDLDDRLKTVGRGILEQRNLVEPLQ